MASAEEIANIVGDLKVADTFGAEMDRRDRGLWNDFVQAMQDQDDILKHSYHSPTPSSSDKRYLQGMFNALDPNHDRGSLENGFGSVDIIFNGLVVVRSSDQHERRSVELKSSPAVKRIDRIPLATCKVEQLTVYPDVGGIDIMRFFGLNIIRMGYQGAEDFREYLENGAKMFVPTANLVKR